MVTRMQTHWFILLKVRVRSPLITTLTVFVLFCPPQLYQNETPLSLMQLKSITNYILQHDHTIK